MTSQLKTFMLLALLSGLIIVLGGALGGKTGIVIAFGLALIMNVGSYWYSDKIVLRMYQARELSESEAPMIYSMVRELAANAQIRVLSPAQTAFGDMQQAEEGRLRAKLLAEALPAYRESWRANLLTAQAAKLENERRTHEENVRTIQADLVARRSTLADLELRERQSGGDQIAGWEAEKARREQDRDRAMRERGKVEAAARELGEALPPTADEFRTLVEAAAARGGAADLKKARDAKIEALIGEEHGIKSELDVLCEEIESLDRSARAFPPCSSGSERGSPPRRDSGPRTCPLRANSSRCSPSRSPGEALSNARSGRSPFRFSCPPNISKLFPVSSTAPTGAPTCAC